MTGLIYVILIAMWGVVLVPRWLRHHDESRRTREAQRLEQVLAPRGATQDGATPDAGRHDDRSQSWGEYFRSLTHLGRSPLLDQLKSPRGRQARRRRNTVLSLLAAFAVALLGSIMGLMPGFATVLCGLVLAGYVSAVFLQLRQWEAQRGGQRPVEPIWSEQAEAQRWRPAPASDGVRVVQGTEAVGSSWDPRETTLPTYVSKPKASKIPRRIDLTREGWTGAGMVEQARQQQASPQLQSQFDREFAAIEPEIEAEIDDYANGQTVDRYYRRAVNE